MKITFDPPDLESRLDEVLREILASTAGELEQGRCERHGHAPAGLRVTPGTDGNVVDFEVIGCCDEYELPEE